jgi:hypothetical protein
MAGHSRPKNGVAEPVIGPAQLGRTRWLAYVPAIHALLCCQDVDARHKAGHDE